MLAAINLMIFRPVIPVLTVVGQHLRAAHGVCVWQRLSSAACRYLRALSRGCIYRRRHTRPNLSSPRGPGIRFPALETIIETRFSRCREILLVPESTCRVDDQGLTTADAILGMCLHEGSCFSIRSQHMLSSGPKETKYFPAAPGYPGSGHLAGPGWPAGQIQNHVFPAGAK